MALAGDAYRVVFAGVCAGASGLADDMRLIQWVPWRGYRDAKMRRFVIWGETRNPRHSRPVTLPKLTEIAIKNSVPRRRNKMVDKSS